jgi:RNA polymerase sigma-70 factor (ECF subfamily)
MRCLQDRQWSALMAAAQDGDGHAYRRLLSECAPFVRAVVRRSIPDPDRAEDVVQEALLTLHRVRHTYDPRRPFQPWLAAITSRRTIDAMRKRGRIGAHEASDDRAYETFADPVANKDLNAVAASEEIASMLGSLSPAQRQAVELVKVRELSLAEASVVSGQSIGALKVNVHRALKAMRVKLQGGAS